MDDLELVPSIYESTPRNTSAVGKGYSPPDLNDRARQRLDLAPLRQSGRVSTRLTGSKVGQHAMVVELHGYKYSVYSWIARLALEEKGVRCDWVEINPFADAVPERYLDLHPFKRVPALVHGEFSIYETNAITRYVDEVFEGPKLQRTEPRERARCSQIISIVDSYAYWPLVRQVFSHSIFRPCMGQPADDAELRRGLDTAPRVLSALEKVASDQQYLCGNAVSLADIHLAPMIGYFVLAAEGRALLEMYIRLTNWWSVLSQRTAYLATAPRLPQVPP